MEKLDLSKIRGKWEEWSVDSKGPIAGGDDTIESIRIVAEKLNEVIDFLVPQENKRGE